MVISLPLKSVILSKARKNSDLSLTAT
jgi:hypothetical protein